MERDPQVIPNLAAGKEIGVYGTGIRALFHHQKGVYCVHMDAELADRFTENKAAFQSVISKLSTEIESIAADNSVELEISRDFDFFPFEVPEGMSIFSSPAAQRIRERLPSAIREWHRRRMGRKA